MNVEDFTEKLSGEVEQAKEKIESLRGEDSIVFPIFTDLHAQNVKCEYAQKIVEALKLITSEIKVDAVVDLGDNLAMLGRDIHISNSDLKGVLEDLFAAVYEALGCPVYMVNGNHDAIGTDFFKPDFWNDIVKNKYGNTKAVYDGAGSYYYVDCDKANTRFVVLSLPSESDLEAEFITPVWAFGKDQLIWLEKEALNTNNDVIILTHVPFYYCDKRDKSQIHDVWNGERAGKSYTTDLCGRIEDCDEAVRIIKAFADREDTRLVVCLSGHTHVDSLWMPYETKGESTNPLPCYQVVTREACNYKSDDADVGVAVDIGVWSPTKNEFDIIRVGDGEDRKITF